MTGPPGGSWQAPPRRYRGGEAGRSCDPRLARYVLRDSSVADQRVRRRLDTDDHRQQVAVSLPINVDRGSWVAGCSRRLTPFHDTARLAPWRSISHERVPLLGLVQKISQFLSQPNGQLQSSSSAHLVLPGPSLTRGGRQPRSSLGSGHRR